MECTLTELCNCSPYSIQYSINVVFINTVCLGLHNPQLVQCSALLVDAQTTCFHSFSFHFTQLILHPVSCFSRLSMSSPLDTKWWALKRCTPSHKISSWRKLWLSWIRDFVFSISRKKIPKLSSSLTPYLCCGFPVFFWNIFLLAFMAAIVHLLAVHRCNFSLCCILIPPCKLSDRFAVWDHVLSGYWCCCSQWDHRNSACADQE